MRRKERVKAAEFAVEVVFEPAAEGGYVVTFPAVPGLVTEGDTLHEARFMAADAVKCHVEGLRKDGRTLPKSLRPMPRKLKETVTVRLRAV